MDDQSTTKELFFLHEGNCDVRNKFLTSKVELKANWREVFRSFSLTGHSSMVEHDKDCALLFGRRGQAPLPLTTPWEMADNTNRYCNGTDQAVESCAVNWPRKRNEGQ